MYFDTESQASNFLLRCKKTKQNTKTPKKNEGKKQDIPRDDPVISTVPETHSILVIERSCADKC